MADFWKMGMESQAHRDQRMHDRVATSTISAARLVDEFHNPNIMRIGTPYPGPVETKIGPMCAAAVSDMKHTPAGLRSSWAAAHYYMDQTISRRDELLAKYKAEREAATAAAAANTDTTSSA